MKNRLGIIMILAATMALLAALACGSSATATVPTQPPPTQTPVQGDPPPEEPKMVEVPAPIEDTTVVAPSEPGGDYVLKITSGLPNGCAKFNGHEVQRDGDGFMVTVTNLMPHPSVAIACTEIYGFHEGEVVLGSGLVAGDVYTASVNDDWEIFFTAQDADGLAMVEKESPIEEIEVADGDGGYRLTIVSRLPKGSSCSKFYGYDVNRRFDERIEVTVTHREVPEGFLFPCTADLPVVVTELPLGPDFADGENFTVSVNGTEYTFPEVVDDTGGESGSNQGGNAGTPDPIEDATVAVQAPLEESTIVPPETASGPYIVKIVSGLPSGCAQFSHYSSSSQGNDFSVEVMNRIPADKNIACTMIYGYHEGELTLGDGALDSGETYTVTINGEIAHSFIAR